MKIVTVVPGPKNHDGIHTAQGTKVMLSDGSELERVHEVTLNASVGGMWTANITVAIERAPEVTAIDLSLRCSDTTTVTNTP